MKILKQAVKMPIVNEEHTPQHQVLINQSILRNLKEDIDNLKQDVKEIKYMMEYLKKYTENKKKIEDSRWFR
jgi:hypothetical protein